MVRPSRAALWPERLFLRVILVGWIQIEPRHGHSYASDRVPLAGSVLEPPSPFGDVGAVPKHGPSHYRPGRCSTGPTGGRSSRRSGRAGLWVTGRRGSDAAALADRPEDWGEPVPRWGPMPEEPRVNFQIEVPDQLPNIYANFLAVWHSQHEFTLDFMVTGMPVPGGDAGPGGTVNVPAKVVARIKIPPTVVDDILRALATNVSIREDAMKALGNQDRPGQNPEERPK